MTLLFLLLKAVLALMLAFLGGAFLRNARGLCAETSAFALRRDRLLGLALYAVSLVAGWVAAIRLASWPSGWGVSPDLLLIGIAGIWGVAVWLGLRRTVSMASVRILGVAAVVVFVAVVITANGELAGADLFLLVAALVWLGTTLLRPGSATK